MNLNQNIYLMKILQNHFKNYMIILNNNIKNYNKNMNKKVIQILKINNMIYQILNIGDLSMVIQQQLLAIKDGSIIIYKKYKIHGNIYVF